MLCYLLPNQMCLTQRSICLVIVMFLIVNYLSFVEPKPNERPLLRHRRSSDEYSSITDRDLLSKQYTLVNTFGGVDILGDVRQYRTGKIDTRDFGQNIHFGYKDRILPGEKERALKELQTQALKGLIRMVNQMLE